MSINTIIIAIIAILVLVILIAILGANIRKFTGTTEKCESRGGECGDTDEAKCKIPKYVHIRGTECDVSTDSTKVCCVPIIDVESE